jgi:dihydrofolate reductase
VAEAEAEVRLPPLVAVAAMAENRIIGRDNRLPWHIPADLRHFKGLTSGGTVIMGRLTFESLGRKPLPKRRNIIVSRTVDPSPRVPAGPEGTTLEWVNSLRGARELAGEDDRVFLIGGSQLYAAALAEGIVDRVELTRVHLAPKGDASFPPFEHGFVLQNSLPAEENGIAFAFETWVRR